MGKVDAVPSAQIFSLKTKMIFFLLTTGTFLGVTPIAHGARGVSRGG